MDKTKNTITCLVTGKERLLTPEELVRQEYIKILIDDYGYAKEDIRIEYPVKRSPSDTRKSLPVDIAVIENGKEKIFIETKNPTISEGLSQLKDYMNFNSSVRYGVWTNGNSDEASVGIHYYEKIITDKGVKYKDIFNIPEKGFYSVDEQIKKKDLKPTNNLKTIFKQMRGFIAANATGTTRDEKILNELMSILICKIYDERYKSDDDYMEFIVIDNDENKTSQNINRMFETKVKDKYPMVFGTTEIINLSPSIITYVVAQLQKYSITGSSHQAISDAFESIISYASKGSQGQFFTPKSVVDLMVNILKPERFKTLIDPACGTAGFLVSAMYYIWDKIDNTHMEVAAKAEEKKEYAMTQLFGVEKDDFLAKMSKSYMAILGDGKAGIFIEDSLNKKDWSDIAKATIRDEYFDYVLTNPPFGKDVKIQQKTREQYIFDSVDIIFLERSINLLKDGGKLGIILPETVFHSPSNKKVRDELMYKHNIFCLIDLPHDTFRPYNNAKCNIIFLEKNRKQQDDVLLIKIDNIGHDHNGETTFLYDINTNTFDNEIVNEDIPNLIKLINNNKFMELISKNPLDLSLEDKNQLNNYKGREKIKYVKYSDIIEEDLLVARNYFQSNLITDNSISIEQLIEEGIIMHFDGHGSPQGHLKGKGNKPYIRVKDIVNLEVYINPLDLIPEFEYQRLFREDKQLKEKDIAFVRRGSYRIGDVGILYKKDTESIFTREILVLRVINECNKYNLTAFNLLWLLNSDEVRCQLKNKIMIDTTLPNIGDRWKKLLIPIYPKHKMAELSKQMEELYEMRSSFWNKYEDIKI